MDCIKRIKEDKEGEMAKGKIEVEVDDMLVDSASITEGTEHASVPDSMKTYAVPESM